MAIGLKIDKKASRVFTVLGDGECQEGEVWEAAATANKYQLDNLIAFVDVNNLQIDGTTDEVMPNLDLGEKFRAFGWEIYNIQSECIATTTDPNALSDRRLRAKAFLIWKMSAAGTASLPTKRNGKSL